MPDTDGTDGDMLRELPDLQHYAPLRGASDYYPLHTFDLPKGADRHYAQQFADMYFLRLAHLKAQVKARAQDAWHDFEVRTASPQQLPPIEPALMAPSWAAPRPSSSSASSMCARASSAGSWAPSSWTWP
jgi:hypothetical protein